MKTLDVILLFLFAFNALGQTKADLQISVETEIAFARASEAKGTRAAFLEFLAAAIVLREKRQPFYGKKSAFVELKKSDKIFRPTVSLNLTAKTSKNYDNLMYWSGVYELKLKDNSVRK